MPQIIARILDARATALVARIVLTFPFWASGLGKLIDFQGGMAEMSHFGLEPAWAFNLATIVTQLGGSVLVIANRWAWLGAGALGVFTALAIPVAHDFWNRDEPARTVEFHFAMILIAVIGAFILAAVLSRRDAKER
jgi:transmembrane protein